jgi:UDP-N-acetylmuramoyl-L-alanyl-D-glutamate--2,6-diaminopimelate ligase
MNGTTFTFVYDNKEYKVHSLLFGKFNIYNSICVISILHEYGISLDSIISSFDKLHSPVGRLDTINYKDNLIIVDYAHTPDAIKNILDTSKELKPKHIYTVFGATGDRDRTKRPIMRDLVLTNSDYAIITNDDPHNEDPNEIIDDLLKNNTKDNYEIELDRKKAIHSAIDKLNSNDLLLILGKGHEEFMIIKDQKIPFNDKKVVLDYLKNK